MIDDMVSRLKSLGYTVVDGDLEILSFLKNKMEEKIRTDCPDDTFDCLYYNIIDWIVADFLVEKRNSGELKTLGDIDFSSASLKSLTEGDISAVWETGRVKSADEKFDGLIKKVFAPVRSL